MYSDEYPVSMRGLAVPKNWRGGRTETRPGDNTTDGGEDSSGPSKSEAFDVLRNGRRRAVLNCFRTRGRELSVKELSTAVAAEEYDVAPDELSSDQYKRVYTGLYQCHLPRMDDLGVLDFDADENTVRLGETLTHIDPYLRPNAGATSARIEFGVAALATAVILSGSIGIGPLGGVSPMALAVLTIAALFGLALFQVVGASNNRR